uniref:Reverse transcriptase Ty1/copia-type domain-containing protein n=1 Tax=Solanum lycopersicum TaxID=4081 RepID=A0A3Q7GX56_SOLLC
MLGHTNAKEGTERSGSQSNSAANANIVQDYASSTGNDIALIVGDKQQGWIIDSGATNHMTSLPTVLDYQQQVLSDKPRRVYLPNGDNVKSPLTEVDTGTSTVDGSIPAQRRSTRSIRAPLWMKDYVAVASLKSVYVDDMMITGNDLSLIKATKGTLLNTFKMKDLGDLRYFLAIEFARSQEGIVMHQRKYALEIISEVGLGAAKPVSTPLDPYVRLTTKEYDDMNGKGEEDKLLEDATIYKRLVGKLLYLNVTRPDIAFATQTLSQFLHQPKQSHLNAALRIVRYIKSQAGQGVLLSSKSSKQLKVYCDADWGACLHTRRSVSGFMVKMGESMISWKSKKQATVSRSSTEAEYRSMASSIAEITWIVKLFKELGAKIQTPSKEHFGWFLEMYQMSALHTYNYKIP